MCRDELDQIMGIWVLKWKEIYRSLFNITVLYSNPRLVSIPDQLYMQLSIGLGKSSQQMQTTQAWLILTVRIHVAWWKIKLAVMDDEAGIQSHYFIKLTYDVDVSLCDKNEVTPSIIYIYIPSTHERVYKYE